MITALVQTRRSAEVKESTYLFCAAAAPSPRLHRHPAEEDAAGGVFTEMVYVTE